MYQDDVSEGKQAGIEPAYALFASGWAVATVIVLVILKSYAYWQTGSTALLGSLVDSLSDMCISLTMLMAVRLSLKPADETHRHGHGKAEGLAALFQAAFLAGAGGFLALHALEKFASPQAVGDHRLGIGVAAVAILLSLLLVCVQNYCLRRAPSLAVKADRAHYATDIVLNASVILALVINMKGGPDWVDPVCGLLIALYFARTAFVIGKEGSDMLMDREMPDAVRAHILSIIESNEEVRGVHDLRTRQSGMALHISFDVELEPEQSLRQAHAVSRELEMALLADYPNAEIIIHKDPHGDPHDARHSVEGIHNP